MVYMPDKAPALPKKPEELGKGAGVSAAAPNVPRNLPADPAARGGAEVLMADREAAEEAGRSGGVAVATGQAHADVRRKL